jgi:hypothetical protein
MTIYAPERDYSGTEGQPTVFLAGSIENGTAEKWQDKMNDLDAVIFNPRRPDWDSSWKNEKENAQFYDQVTWELDHLEKADIIAMYFDPNTQSPISLLELGLYASSKKLVVCCPKEFWRSGNVEITCNRYNVPFFNQKESWLIEIKNRITKIGQFKAAYGY